MAVEANRSADGAVGTPGARGRLGDAMTARLEPWTPGPWHVEAGDVGGPVIIAPLPPVYDRPDDIEVAQCFKENDARLIALAPEMAELLDAISGNLTDSDFLSSPAAAADYALEARELLARARGEDH